MRLLFLLIIGVLTADPGDIVYTKIVNSEAFKFQKDSYCREKSEPNSKIWIEDFNNDLSELIWNYSISNGFYENKNYIEGWGNGELQFYTKPGDDSISYTSKNLFVNDGYLKIQPIYKQTTKTSSKKKETGFNFTSARINTKDLKDFSYPSRITICFKVPKGIGFWPAFWLMPNDQSLWPSGGEIDIIENRGRISNVVSSALHFGKKFNEKSTIVGEVMIPAKVSFQNKFHSITLEWRKNSLKFFLDKEQVPYFEITDSHQEFYKYKYPFNRAYYMIINVAVGGKYDDFWVDKNAFCSNEECSNMKNPDDHRFIIDWIEYEELDSSVN
tara:strand:+ start:313 stop:1296 length:984 start_codon:yes stop_codon:yes gene_type:complete